MNSYQLSKQYGMLSRDEIDLIKQCVKSLSSPKPIIVNIGANVGTSACAMLEANRECFIFSIDKHPCPEERNNLVACGLPANKVVRILADSTRIDTAHWPCRVDLVFVDGSHTTEAIEKDTLNWQHLTDCMIFHDVYHPNLPEATPLVNRLMKDWQQIGQARYMVAFQRVKNGNRHS